MKNFTLKLFVIIFMAQSLISSINLFSQGCYNPFVEYIVSTASLSSVSMFNRELTGDTATVIGGLPYLIYTRYYLSPANDKAAQYIYEKFQSFGYTPRYQVYSATGKNVIAVKQGVKYPNKQYLIGAHYDNWTTIFSDTTHGADDNASGTCAVLEAARVLAPYDFNYTLVFVAFDEEEIGLYGSKSYADSAYFNGDSLLGVINLDMVGFDPNNTNMLYIYTDTNSSRFSDILYSSCQYYQPLLNPQKRFASGFGGSDHASFWQRGFVASMFFEYYFNSYYHTVEDNYEHINKPFMLGIIKSAIAALVTVGRDYIIDFYHTPLASTYDTTSREVTAVIKTKGNIAGGSNQPRLYYKTNSTQFYYTSAFYISRDTFKFLMPGFPVGSRVYYYLAAQDSAATMVGSVPTGCRGMNPPGTVPPPNYYSYYILSNFYACSNTLPKNIPPRTIIYDSIYVAGNKLINDVDISLTINHPNDTDLYIFVTRSTLGQTNLSLHNGGGGDNYINTVFDDEADTLITQGTPPFTGRYRPEVALNKYDNTNSEGYWILKILNMSNSDTGQLVSWCVDLQVFDPIAITNNQIPVKYNLSQNYPNPFNASTRISYELAKDGYVKLIVYDILGREVSVLTKDEQKAGKYDVVWNAVDLPSGVYFYRLSHPEYTEAKKMVLIK